MENINFFKYSNKDKDTLLREFKSSLEKGLSSREADERLKNYGLNEISTKRNRWYHIFFRQFRSPFIYILFAATIFAYFLGEKMDAMMITLCIVINAVLGFYQEYKSEKTLELLKKYTISSVRVIRDGEEKILKSLEIVPGDILILETGDKVPADLRLLESYDLSIDETILTGESISARKNSDIIKENIDSLYDAQNIVFSGTVVVSGYAKAIVLLTGRKTRIGNITSLAVETKHVSDFEKGIAKLSSFILKLVVGTLVLVLVANIALKGVHGTGMFDLIFFAIALAVSVIPEALPVVMTFSLSRGALRLAKQKVVVRRLSAIEDLGGIEVLCSDKTGTLTENKLEIEDLYGGKDKDLVFYANLASSSPQKQKLEPFDIALWAGLKKEEVGLVDSYTRVLECPFDPVRRVNSVVVSDGKKNEIILRGAPEAVFELCDLGEEEKNKAKEWIGEQGECGHRVLAIAKNKIRLLKDKDIKYFEKNLEFLGIISFVDPIKATTRLAVKQAKDLGIAFKVITGDSGEVSGAVAYSIGLVDSPKDVISGDEFSKLNDIKKVEAVTKYSVFYRVSPEQKFSIIETLQSKYRVGFLGEGINDAPALKIAGVSIVVQSASDISRENSDIVLLESDLKVIVDGIKEGRAIFINTTKYIKTTLASNFGNFYSLALSSLFIKSLPMLPLQILFLNLLSDMPMIAIATDSVDDEEVKKPRSYDSKEMVAFCTILGIVSSFADIAMFLIFMRHEPAILQTSWFIVSVLTEIVFIFSIRSKKFFLKAKPPSLIIGIVTVLSIAIAFIIPFTAFGHNIFRFVSLPGKFIIIIILIVAFEFIASEITKLIYYRIRDKREAKVL